MRVSGSGEHLHDATTVLECPFSESRLTSSLLLPTKRDGNRNTDKLKNSNCIQLIRNLLNDLLKIVVALFFLACFLPSLSSPLILFLPSLFPSKKALPRVPTPAGPTWAGEMGGPKLSFLCVARRRELERLAREMQEKKLQQELERQKEEDELKRRIKKPKPGPAKEEPPLKKSQVPPNKQVAALTSCLLRSK